MTNPKAAGPGKCYCGHDCSRCVVYVATINDNAALRRQAQEFYQTAFHQSVPLDRIRCLGGRTSAVFNSCHACPWRQCCRERRINACEECDDYPCTAFAAYQAKYVNKYLQVADEG
ncbi:MAG TPA: DUF3795 domain-containing protein [Firmicutes bacterium]|nr:DUF3795 domain-containing protein [Bacillota bacterium]